MNLYIEWAIKDWGPYSFKKESMGYGIEREIWLTAANRQGPIPICSHTEVWTRCSFQLQSWLSTEPLHTCPRWCHHFYCLIIVSNVVMWSILLLRWIIRQQLNFVTIESSGSDHGDEKHLLSRVRCAKLQYNFRSSVTNWKLEYFFQSDY